jgi:hypothetical protein
MLYYAMLSIHFRDVLVDSVMYSLLFYILASVPTKRMFSGVLTGVSDRILLHAFVFGTIYLIIQKIIRRI